MKKNHKREVDRTPPVANPMSSQATLNLPLKFVSLSNERTVYEQLFRFIRGSARGPGVTAPGIADVTVTRTLAVV